MDVVYAPWRYSYIKDPGRRTSCFLCEAAAGGDPLVTHRGRRVFAILNRYPYTWGHVMVAPYRHVAEVEDLTAEEFVEMVRMAGRLREAVGRAVGARDFIVGLNIGRAAGAGVEGHIHMHVIPRDTRVESGEGLEGRLEELARRLRGT